ncbi:Uncharacterised protein [Escherichia coli]|nr:Uncharacterised protein [Escherichia coli]
MKTFRWKVKPGMDVGFGPLPSGKCALVMAIPSERLPG